MAGVGEPGGILALLDLIEERRQPLRYDFRSRFGCGLDTVPDEIGWSEARDLIAILRADPSTALAAAMEGWKHPITRESLALADLIDLQGQSKAGRKWKPYGRPWETKGETTHRGNTAGRSPAEVIEILRQFGHGLS